ncbi:hypothetical protein SJAG_00205 [Schizosaccharomyces japonicus yFS275]|uniref:Uncharacterized protein n=1 Tax=Schizosaccharomyces japonicus (strain yFS275 / FY16936) TaxID=402676 RepID=B6JV05_SCHJY|nr:hypothetical protein SJAG_00205 [Schizosaccharomyces japonicus yFS275]EEB05206.1 hypothetical protein SJAG_00205 [Schizosaccharomyces japonicus yFS275]
MSKKRSASRNADGFSKIRILEAVCSSMDNLSLAEKDELYEDVEMTVYKRLSYYKDKYTIVVEDIEAELEEEEEEEERNKSSEISQNRVKLTVISPLFNKMKRNMLRMLCNPRTIEMQTGYPLTREKSEESSSIRENNLTSCKTTTHAH